VRVRVRVKVRIGHGRRRTVHAGRAGVRQAARHCEVPQRQRRTILQIARPLRPLQGTQCHQKNKTQDVISGTLYLLDRYHYYSITILSSKSDSDAHIKADSYTKVCFQLPHESSRDRYSARTDIASKQGSIVLHGRHRREPRLLPGMLRLGGLLVCNVLPRCTVQPHTAHIIYKIMAAEGAP